MTQPIRIVIAEDHPIFRKGLVDIIEGRPGNEVIHQAGDGANLVRAVREMRPHLAIVDVELPVLSGFDAVRQMNEESLQVGLIFLTMYKGEDAFNEAMDLGAKGYVIKDSAMEGIVTAIETVAAGGHYISPEISEYLFSRAQRAQSAMNQLAGLTPAERRVLKLVSEFKSSKEIAQLLGVSARTVENHRAGISAKLGLQGPQRLANFAYQNRSWL